MLNSRITAVSHYLPENVITNNDLSKLMTTSDEWITERTGIKERRFVTPGTSTADIAEKACLQMKNKIGEEAFQEIDLIVMATLSPDLYFPGVGTLLQQRLGLKNIPALDIRAQCSGLVYGLSTVDAFIKSKQYKKILLVCAEVQSPALELNDNGRDMAVLFGDGAGALLIEAVSDSEQASSSNKISGIIDSALGSDGSGADVLCVKAPGTAIKGFMTSEAYEQGLWHPHMDGKLVFKNAVTRLCEVAEKILVRNKVRPEQLDFVLPHQANLRINEMVREKLGLPSEKVLNNIHKYGNTTAATIPILMSEAVEAGQLKSGDLVLTLAFGAGFTWGANLVRW
jgi:3-oxoacyl-[acyl-carrier-protein] synthase-3